jgi:hypothetical protein
MGAGGRHRHRAAQNPLGRKADRMSRSDIARRTLADGEIDQINGGIIPFIVPGILLGMAYCWLDGDFDTKPVLGDYPTGPKNTG